MPDFSRRRPVPQGEALRGGTLLLSLFVMLLFFLLFAVIFALCVALLNYILRIAVVRISCCMVVQDDVFVAG